MWNYLGKRVLFGILTILIIILVVYLSVAQFSENPFLESVKQAGEGKQSNEADKIAFEKSIEFHLIPNVRYEDYSNGRWFSLKLNPFIRLGYWFKDIFNSERPFGLVLHPNDLTALGAKSIPALFFNTLKFTTIITLPAFIISSILGISLGVVAGYKRGGVVDSTINGFSILFVALPSFVLAPLLITFMLKYFGIAPSFGNPWDKQHLDTWTTGRIIASWIPPILIIVLGSLSGYITFTRNQIITVLSSNHILIAKSKGLSQSQIFFKYVLRNISIPLATILIPSYLIFLSGGIVIETYWGVPGVSTILSQAFPKGEINIIMFSTVFFTTLGVFTTILVDISYVFLDPRIKYGSSSSRSISREIKASIERNKLYDHYLQKLSQGGDR